MSLPLVQCRSSPPGRPSLARWVLLLVILIAAQVALAAQANAQVARDRYEIPALPLDIALSRFSEVSGIDVLRREPTATERRSSPVRGDFTAAEALGVLLDGTGLIARFTSSRSAIIVPANSADEPWIAPAGDAGAGRALLNLDMMRVTAPRMIGSPRGDGGDEAFAQRLVVVIRRMVMEREVFQGGNSTDLRIAMRITAEGALHEVRIVRGSRDRTIDARVRTLLEGANLALIPPDGLRQPLLFDVSGR